VIARSWLLVIAIGICGCAGIQQNNSAVQRPDAAMAAQLKELRQELQTALAKGDRPELERLLDPTFVFVHSTGKVESRSAFIDRMVAAGTAHGAAEIDFLDDDIRVYGNTVVWISHSTRHAGPMSFVATDILIRSKNGWRWVSVQSTRTDH
jgi:hypothetical protein